MKYFQTCAPILWQSWEIKLVQWSHTHTQKCSTSETWHEGASMHFSNTSMIFSPASQLCNQPHWTFSIGFFQVHAFSAHSQTTHVSQVGLCPKFVLLKLSELYYFISSKPFWRLLEPVDKGLTIRAQTRPEQDKKVHDNWKHELNSNWRVQRSPWRSLQAHLFVYPLRKTLVVIRNRCETCNTHTQSAVYLLQAKVCEERAT